MSPFSSGEIFSLGDLSSLEFQSVWICNLIPRIWSALSLRWLVYNIYQVPCLIFLPHFMYSRYVGATDTTIIPGEEGEPNNCPRCHGKVHSIVTHSIETLERVSKLVHSFFKSSFSYKFNKRWTFFKTLEIWKTYPWIAPKSEYPKNVNTTIFGQLKGVLFNMQL